MSKLDWWEFTVDLCRGGPAAACVILAAKLCEVELHHHDLGVDDGLALLTEAATAVGRSPEWQSTLSDGCPDDRTAPN